MSGLGRWWRDRSPREQAMLGVMGALIVLVLGWLLIARPLSAALEAARAREAAAAEAVGAARARAARARVSAASASAPLPIDSYVTRSASDAGYPNARVTAQGPTRAALAIAAARPQVLFGWIASLEAHGVVVETLRASAGADHTVAIEATLRARGSR
jgi:general secretion pathway protein M